MQKKFKLEKVLNYRSLILEKEKAQLAVLAQQEQTIIKEIKNIMSVIAQKQREMSEAQAEGDLNMTQMYQKYITKLEGMRNQMQTKLAQHRQVMHKQKTATVKAYQSKSIIDKLYARHKAAYNSFLDKEEAKVVEDIITTRKASAINSE
ncbi:MAG: flagellar export protein FliJ [Deferribacteraceae bacterium]|jgi:flagellar export protein FliJ|nr:flagellar export protein FliJ [Deferribacteraceae bacterium]